MWFYNQLLVCVVIYLYYIWCLKFLKPSCYLENGEAFYIKEKQAWMSSFVFDGNQMITQWREVNKYGFDYIDFS